MIYIISGASRSGKTKIGTQLMKELNIPHIEIDNIMMSFFIGMPETTIHPEDWPHITAGKMKPFLEAYIKTSIEANKSLILEGEQFTPEHVKELLVNYKNSIKACFLGFTEISVEDKVSNIKTYAEANDWLMTFEEWYIDEHVNNMIEYSKKIKSECETIQVKYVDTSVDFTKKIEQALAYLKE